MVSVTCTLLIRIVNFIQPKPYRWRKLRRTASEGMNARSSAQYKPLQEKEAALLAGHLIRDPDQWDDHLRRYHLSAVCILSQTRHFIDLQHRQSYQLCMDGHQWNPSLRLMPWLGVSTI